MANIEILFETAKGLGGNMCFYHGMGFGEEWWVVGMARH